ncbi:unnamed protein product [Echinostoma caproni]|uniref:Ras-GAP domain-containing protein n=1 Tax=Echinostoma caproni TaxID=27848 RepID=A0A183A6K5_9TREM|nr:unnamed protein product [Echinostoma caproni]
MTVEYSLEVYWSRSMDNSRIQSRSHTPMSGDPNWVSITDLRGRPLAVKITEQSPKSNLLPMSLQNLSQSDRDIWTNGSRPRSANSLHFTFSQSASHVGGARTRVRTASNGLPDSWNTFDSALGRSSSVPPAPGGLILPEYSHGSIDHSAPSSALFSPFIRRSVDYKHPTYYYHPDSETQSVIEEQEEEQGVNLDNPLDEIHKETHHLESEENQKHMCLPKPTFAIRSQKRNNEKSEANPVPSSSNAAKADPDATENRTSIGRFRISQRRAKSSSDVHSEPNHEEVESKHVLKRLKQRAQTFLRPHKRNERFGSLSKQALGGTLKALAGFSTGLLTVDPALEVKNNDVFGARSCPNIHDGRGARSHPQDSSSLLSVSDDFPGSVGAIHSFYCSPGTYRRQLMHVLVDDFSSNISRENTDPGITTKHSGQREPPSSACIQTDLSGNCQTNGVSFSNLSSVRRDSGHGSMSPLPTDVSAGTGSRTWFSSTEQNSPYSTQIETNAKPHIPSTNTELWKTLEQPPTQTKQFAAIAPMVASCLTAERPLSESGDTMKKTEPQLCVPLETSLITGIQVAPDQIESTPIREHVDTFGKVEVIPIHNVTSEVRDSSETDKRSPTSTFSEVDQPVDQAANPELMRHTINTSINSTQVLQSPNTTPHFTSNFEFQLTSTGKTDEFHSHETCESEYQDDDTILRSQKSHLDQTEPYSMNQLDSNAKPSNLTGISGLNVSGASQLLETDLDADVYPDLVGGSISPAAFGLSTSEVVVNPRPGSPPATDTSEGVREVVCSQPFDVSHDWSEADASLAGVPEIPSIVESIEQRRTGSVEPISDMISDVSSDYLDNKTETRPGVSSVENSDHDSNVHIVDIRPASQSQTVPEINEYDSGLDAELTETLHAVPDLSEAVALPQGTYPTALKQHSVLSSNAPQSELVSNATECSQQLDNHTETRVDSELSAPICEISVQPSLNEQEGGRTQTHDETSATYGKLSSSEQVTVDEPGARIPSKSIGALTMAAAIDNPETEQRPLSNELNACHEKMQQFTEQPICAVDSVVPSESAVCVDNETRLQPSSSNEEASTETGSSWTRWISQKLFGSSDGSRNVSETEGNSLNEETTSSKQDTKILPEEIVPEEVVESVKTEDLPFLPPKTEEEAHCAGTSPIQSPHMHQEDRDYPVESIISRNNVDSIQLLRSAPEGQSLLYKTIQLVDDKQQRLVHLDSRAEPEDNDVLFAHESTSAYENKRPSEASAAQVDFQGNEKHGADEVSLNPSEIVANISHSLQNDIAHSSVYEINNVAQLDANKIESHKYIQQNHIEPNMESNSHQITPNVGGADNVISLAENPCQQSVQIHTEDAAVVDSEEAELSPIQATLSAVQETLPKLERNAYRTAFLPQNSTSISDQGNQDDMLVLHEFSRQIVSGVMDIVADRLEKDVDEKRNSKQTDQTVKPVPAFDEQSSSAISAPLSVSTVPLEVSLISITSTSRPIAPADPSQGFDETLCMNQTVKKQDDRLHVYQGQNDPNVEAKIRTVDSPIVQVINEIQNAKSTPLGSEVNGASMFYPVEMNDEVGEQTPFVDQVQKYVEHTAHYPIEKVNETEGNIEDVPSSIPIEAHSDVLKVPAENDPSNIRSEGMPIDLNNRLQVGKVLDRSMNEEHINEASTTVGESGVAGLQPTSSANLEGTQGMSNDQLRPYGSSANVVQRPSQWSFVMVSSMFHFVTIYIPRHLYWFYTATFESRERLYEAMSERGIRLAIAWERIEAGLRNPYCVAVVFIGITSVAPHLSHWPDFLSRAFHLCDFYLFTPPFWVDRPILYHLGQLAHSFHQSLRWHGRTAITSFRQYPWALVNPTNQ